MPQNSVKVGQNMSKTFINLFINKFFIPVLPFFVGGFVAKLNYEGALDNMITDFGPLIFLIIVFQLLYCLVLLTVSTHFSITKALSILKDLLPPYLTGMMTMSGAAALPLSILATKKHLKNPTIADGFLPPATNVHLLGDGISVPFLITALLLSCGAGAPSLENLVPASLYMAFLRFGIVSIPGGGIFVMLPLLEGTFHFTPEMTGLITAIYILFDLFNTANNVLANGLSTLLFEKIWRQVQKIIPKKGNSSVSS
jgi:Na+/H+-dicarboxylate symporter